MVKKFIQFINEKNDSNGRDIISFLEKLTQITSGYQRQMYEKMLSDSKIIRCTSIYSIFSEDEIRKIKMEIHPRQKECYKNSYLLTECDIPDIMYCEGYMSCMGIPIEHAFNKVGDKYIDITAELALHRDIDNDEYVVFGEYTNKEVMDVISKTKFYGGIYNKLFIESIENKKG